jgi:formiminotetrahydrofolate cyclodeaminase
MPVGEIFARITDSGNSTVGGGAASALAGAMASGLVGMVSLLSRGKGLGLDDAAYESFSGELGDIASKLEDGAFADEAAYLGIKAALALPKATDKEKSKRRSALEAAATEAANTPLGNARLAARVLEIASELEGRYNAAAASDMECGKMLARSAVVGCALNVDANLPMIKNEESARFFRSESEKLKRLAEHLIS